MTRITANLLPLVDGHAVHLVGCSCAEVAGSLRAEDAPPHGTTAASTMERAIAEMYRKGYLGIIAPDQLFLRRCTAEKAPRAAQDVYFKDRRTIERNTVRALVNHGRAAATRAEHSRLERYRPRRRYGYTGDLPPAPRADALYAHLSTTRVHELYQALFRGLHIPDDDDIPVGLTEPILVRAMTGIRGEVARWAGPELGRDCELEEVHGVHSLMTRAVTEARRDGEGIFVRAVRSSMALLYAQRALHEAIRR